MFTNFIYIFPTGSQLIVGSVVPYLHICSLDYNSLTNYAITDSTSISIRLNSSRQVQAPFEAIPKKIFFIV